MAHWGSIVTFLVVLIALNTHGAFGKLECEDLPMEDCAYAVSGSGERCVLEKYITNRGDSVYECQTSIILADRREPYIESDDCVNACGLERLSVGLSSEGLLVRNFVEKLCSSSCQDSCPNVVDLFSKLAAGEGLYLPKVCNFLKPITPRRLGGIKPELADRTNSVIEAWSLAAAPVSSPFSESGIALAPIGQ
ncbi:hypothetical protein O6H91_18G078400 [Diphasiastrum complanatum]|uniref:Uncharacterized protein n=1 Tax=Diphasiastrum complanatum TaxID=34168 RepID=A0ACC2B2T3_DIPCM|nr:hypothetical protein O6H91_18G078400 [Diphasiastrum complanatum]